MSSRSSRVRATAVTAAVVALLATVALLAGAAPSAAVGSERAAALAWLSVELDANGGALPGPGGSAVDRGLTADVALTMTLAGADRADRLADDVLAATGSYTTWEDVPGDFPGVRLAGPTAKLALLAATSGRDLQDPAVGGGTALGPELLSLVTPSGAMAGRVADRNPFAPDSSNTFSQAYAVLALSHTDDGPPTDVVDFLVDQQCPGGGLRLFVTGGRSCADDAQADLDATALALQALDTVPAEDSVRAAMARATGWMLARQRADGSFGNTGATEAPNANSTALAAQTLRSLGQGDAADRATGWILDELALTAEIVEGTPAAGEVGAVAYRPEARATALASGIAPQARDQWRRSTAQAVLAMGLGPFGVPADAPPVTPTSVATTAPPAPPSTAAPTTAAPTTATPAPAPTSAPPTAAPAPAPAAPNGGTATPPASVLAASAASSGTAPTRLADTGNAALLVGVGLVLVGAGGVVVGGRGLRVAGVRR